MSGSGALIFSALETNMFGYYLGAILLIAGSLSNRKIFEINNLYRSINR